jgi:hypothetical protein
MNPSRQTSAGAHKLYSRQMIQTEGRLGVGQRALDVLAVVALSAATAFLAFLAGLASLKPLDGAWHSDGRFFVSFGFAFLGGGVGTVLTLGLLKMADRVIRLALVAYLAYALVLALILVEIIEDLRSGG